MSVPHWGMGYWSKLVAELRTEKILFLSPRQWKILGTATTPIKASIGVPGMMEGWVLMACGRGRLLPTAPHFPISAEDTTNHRNGRTSKTYFWVRNMDTTAQKTQFPKLPIREAIHIC